MVRLRVRLSPPERTGDLKGDRVRIRVRFRIRVMVMVMVGYGPR